MSANIALLYTGGTIGMAEDPTSKMLVPLDFEHLNTQIPELDKLNVSITVFQMWEPLDSSDVQPKHWLELAQKIAAEYDNYDGFVILHGTDTMAYTASALSFLFQNLSKPIVLTGSQLPIGVLRTDGKENLISAIEIAAATKEGSPMVPEVCIYFEYKLLRGNRSKKVSTEHFDAFKSPNYPALAEAGVHIQYKEQYISRDHFGTFGSRNQLSERVMGLKLFPGFDANIIRTLNDSNQYDALILQGFGAGNVGTSHALHKELERWTQSGKILAIGSQCVYGSIYLNAYASSANLADMGAVDTHDQTFESSICKMMVSLGNSATLSEARNKFAGNWAGEHSASTA